MASGSRPVEVGDARAMRGAEELSAPGWWQAPRVTAWHHRVVTDRVDTGDPPDEPTDDPMQASIRSDEEQQRRDHPDGDDDAAGVAPAFDVPDPTDAPDLTGSAWSQLSRFGLAGSVMLVVLAVLVVLLAVLSPDQVSPVLGRGIGVALIVASIWIAATRVRRSSNRWRLTSLLVGVSAVGLLLLIDTDRWLRPIGWIIGVVMVLAGVRLLLTGRRVTDGAEPQLVGALALIAGGAVAYLAFETFFEAIVVISALLAVASGVIGVAVRSGFTTVAPRSSRNRPILLRWIDGKSQATESRDAVQETVFFEGATAPTRLGRFGLMMLFASVISAAGVLSDSTAVVIGAMLIAPLITPMMGMGLALVTGWPNRLGRSTLVVFTGSLIAIGTGWLISAVTDAAVDLETNSQIVTRSSPGMLDLVIAIGAGAAGAYALSRKEVSSSLPGVAVAIALVPPLSVIGVTAEAGDWEQASGTLLLFLTNLVAIILAGGAVFLLTGVVPLRRFAGHQHRVRTALGAVGALAVVVVGGLVINGRQITADAFDLDQERGVVADWLGDDSPFTVTSVEVTDGDVAVVLAGPGRPPSAELLADDLADRLGSDVQLDLQWTPRERVVVSSG